ncbi:hypothetical protein PMAYCL1PPCAC_17999, partial [Pristionchus mayeri]
MEDLPDEGINLDSLPPDIARVIIRMEPESHLNMRLISRMCNNLVLEFRPLSARLIPLERINFYPVNSTHQGKEEEKHIQMSAIVPHKIEKYIGVGEWLTVSKRYNDGSIEVESRTHRMTRFGGKFSLSILMAIAYVLAAFVVKMMHSSEEPLHSFLLSGLFITILILSLGIALKRWVDRFPQSAALDTFAN